MALDVSLIVGEARAAYIALGKSFGSPTVIEQGRQSLAAARRHAPALAAQGFTTTDADDLEDLIAQNVAAGGSRDGALEKEPPLPPSPMPRQRRASRG